MTLSKKDVSFFSPGSANLPIGVPKDANREIGAPGIPATRD